MKLQTKIGLTLFVLGFVGVMSLLLTPLPLDALPREVVADLPEKALPYLTLINPTIFLIVAILLGGSLAPKVQLSSPLIKELHLKGDYKKILFKQLRSGVAFGVIAGIVLTIISLLMKPLLSDEFLQIEKKFSPSPITRFLYGGITEEILVRWGFMTFIVWVIWKLFWRNTPVIKNQVYWAAVIISAVVFGIGHLPVVFMLLKSPTTFLIAYVVVANSVFGIIAGWLYWKKGLEAAMFAHITVHVILIIAGLVK